MNILYLGYWSVNDGLSHATIKPHLEILGRFEKVRSLIFISIERSDTQVDCRWKIPKMHHIPYYSVPKPFMMDKYRELIDLPKWIIRLCRQYSINKIICRASPAGIYGYLVWKKIKVPYYVESFEPHADYMLEGDTWKKWDIRYLVQRFFEHKQRLTAQGLMPVTMSYKQKLQEDAEISCAIELIPCTVDQDRFRFSIRQRNNIRLSLGLSEIDIVGVYVGKFGDIYYDDEAFRFFTSCYRHIRHFFLLLLTPMESQFIDRKLKKYGFPIERCWHGYVDYEGVAGYLSAADFAFCPVKESPSRKYCSPVKNGEYWSNGLPILITDGIGDDFKIIKAYGGGMIVNYVKGMTGTWFNTLSNVIHEANKNRLGNQSVINARIHRSRGIVKDVYRKLLINEDIRQADQSTV